MPEPVSESPIEEVRLVERYRRVSGHAFSTASPPDHLLHLVISGRVRQECDGRSYVLGPGDAIWYHDDEHVAGQVLEGPWEFYSVNFTAPTLPPPGEDRRLMSGVPVQAASGFERLLTAWRGAVGIERTLRVHAALADLVACVLPQPGAVGLIDAQVRLWWWLEARVRRDLAHPLSLSDLAALAKVSPATLARVCRRATGMSPLRRLKELRLGHARGLVQRSRLAITTIADRVGYGRVHEFSRDYRRAYGMSPSSDRGDAASAR